MMIDQTFTFRHILHKQLHHIQVCDIWYERSKWKQKAVAFYRIQLPLDANSGGLHPPKISAASPPIHLA